VLILFIYYLFDSQEKVAPSTSSCTNDEQASQTIDKAFMNYRSLFCPTNEARATDLNPHKQREIVNLVEEMITEMQSEAHICVVCLEEIRVVSPVWACKSCYAVIHLQCIQVNTTTMSMQLISYIVQCLVSCQHFECVTRMAITSCVHNEQSIAVLGKQQS
jgi:ribosomal protein L37AE/L43A